MINFNVLLFAKIKRVLKREKKIIFFKLKFKNALGFRNNICINKKSIIIIESYINNNRNKKNYLFK